MDDIQIKAEGKRITYDQALYFLPDKREIYSGKLDGAEGMLKLSLYNVGFERFLEFLSPNEKQILKDLLKVL